MYVRVAAAMVLSAPNAPYCSFGYRRVLDSTMSFECVHCGTSIEDEALNVPRSGAQCPSCKKDPTEGWSPYTPEVAELGRKVADEMYLRLMIQDFGVREAALFFLEDLLLEQRHELYIMMGRKPGIEQKCSVCNADV